MSHHPLIVGIKDCYAKIEPTNLALTRPMGRKRGAGLEEVAILLYV